MQKKKYKATIVFGTVCGAHKMNSQQIREHASRERKITYGKVSEASVYVALDRACPDSVFRVNEFVPFRAWLINGIYPGEQRYRAGHRAVNRCVTFDLGDELPLLDEFFDVPRVRYGMAVVTRDIEF